MENVAPVRALNRRSRSLLQAGLVVVALGFFLAIVAQFVLTIKLLPPSHSLYQAYTLGGNVVFWAGVIVLLVGLAMLIRAFTRRKENDLALMVGDLLAQSGYFDNHYSFIRNINRSGLGYIDAVLLGPPGVLVFRILDNRGAYANEGSNWLEQNSKGEWMPFRINPTREAVEDIQHMRQYLGRKQLSDVPVFGVIIFTAGEQEVQIFEKEPLVPISHLHSLVQNLGNQYLLKLDRIPQPSFATIRRLLLDEG